MFEVGLAAGRRADAARASSASRAHAAHRGRHRNRRRRCDSPCARAVRITRQAISPRLATRIFPAHHLRDPRRRGASRRKAVHAFARPRRCAAPRQTLRRPRRRASHRAAWCGAPSSGLGRRVRAGARSASTSASIVASVASRRLRLADVMHQADAPSPRGRSTAAAVTAMRRVCGGADACGDEGCDLRRHDTEAGLGHGKARRPRRGRRRRLQASPRPPPMAAPSTASTMVCGKLSNALQERPKRRLTERDRVALAGRRRLATCTAP